MLGIPRRKRPKFNYDAPLSTNDTSLALAVEVGEVEDRALETVKLLALLSEFPTRPTMSANEVRYRVFTVVKANLEELGILLGDHPTIFNTPQGLPELMEVLLSVPDLNDLEDEDVETLITGLPVPLLECIAMAREFVDGKIPAYDTIIYSSPFFKGMEKRIAWHHYPSSAGESFPTDCEVWYVLYLISRATRGLSTDQARPKVMEILDDAQCHRIAIGRVRLPGETQYDFEVRKDREKLWAKDREKYHIIRERGVTLAVRGMLHHLFKEDPTGTRAKIFYKEVAQIMWITLGLKQLPHEALGELTGKPTGSRARAEGAATSKHHSTRTRVKTSSRTTRLHHEGYWRKQTKMSDEERDAWQKEHYQRWRARAVENPQLMENNRHRSREDKRKLWARAKEDFALYDRLMTAQRDNFNKRAPAVKRRKVVSELKQIRDSNITKLAQLRERSAEFDTNREFDRHVRAYLAIHRDAIDVSDECQQVGAEAAELVYAEFSATALLDGMSVSDETAALYETSTAAYDTQAAAIVTEADRAAIHAAWKARQQYTLEYAERVVREGVSIEPAEKLDPPVWPEQVWPSGDSKVVLRDGSRKRVDELVAGDKIMVNGIPFVLQSNPVKHTATDYVKAEGLYGDFAFTQPTWADGVPNLDGRHMLLKEQLIWGDDPCPKELVDLVEEYVPNPMKQRLLNSPHEMKRFWCEVCQIIGKYVGDGTERELAFAIDWSDPTEIDDYRRHARRHGMHCELYLPPAATPANLKPFLEDDKLKNRIVLCCPDEYHRELLKNLEREGHCSATRAGSIRIFEGSHTSRRDRHFTSSWFWRMLSDGLKIPKFKKEKDQPGLGKGLHYFAQILIKASCKDLARCFLAGLIDSDGHTDKSGAATIATSFVNIREEIISVIESLGMSAKYSTQHYPNETREILGLICHVYDCHNIRLGREGSYPGQLRDRVTWFCGLPRKSCRNTAKFNLTTIRSAPRDFYELPIPENVAMVALGNKYEIPCPLVSYADLHKAEELDEEPSESADSADTTLVADQLEV